MNTTPTGRPKMQHSPSMRMWIEMMLETDTPSYRAKPIEERRRFEYLMDGRAKWAFKFPYSEMDARVILIAKRMGLLTDDEWERLWEGRTGRSVKYMTAIDEVWEKVFGYDVPRWLRGEATESILGWLRAKVDNPALPIPSLRFFESGEPELKPIAKSTDAAQPDDELNSELGFTERVALVLYAQSRPDKQAEIRKIWQAQGKYHLLDAVCCPVHKPEPEPVDPEQVAHADQARIDAVAGELLQGIEF